MTFLDAEAVPETKQDHGLDETYFASLERLLQAIHARRMNHGDIRRKNLLRDRLTGDAVLVDFTQSFRFGEGTGLLSSFIERRAYRIDRLEFLKLKVWYLKKRRLSPEEKAELQDVPGYLRVGRWLRKKVYRPLKHALWR